MNPEQISTLKTKILNTVAALRFPNKEKMLRLAHVAEKDGEFHIHYFTNSAVLERNYDTDIETSISESLDHINELHEANIEVSLVYENALKYGWSHPWSETAFDKYPVFVGMKLENGQLRGNVFYDTHLSGRVMESIAKKYVESAVAISSPLNMKSYQTWLGLVYTGLSPTFAGQQEMCEFMPKSLAGQFSVMVHDGVEWLHGLKSKDTDLKLSSFADFHNVPVSKAKQSLREELNHAFFNQASLQGQLSDLSPALFSLSEQGALKYMDFENDDGVKALLGIWNSHREDAPQAGGARLYWWNDEARVFNALDPEEPNWKQEFFEGHEPAMGVFKGDCKNEMLIVLYSQGREHWGDSRMSTIICDVNGTQLYDVGCDQSEYDECYYTWQGMQRLKNLLKKKLINPNRRQH